MIDTANVREARQDLERAITDWCDNTPGEHDSCRFQIMRLRIDLLVVAVEHAARIAQINEDYEKIKGLI